MLRLACSLATERRVPLIASDHSVMVRRRPTRLMQSPPGPKSRRRRHRPMYGPIPCSWWLPATRLPGRSLHVGAVCWMLAGWERSASFELVLDGWADLGLSRFAVSRGLDTLEQAELVSVARKPGQSPIVTVRDVSDRAS